jgi:hypothetical protein
MLFYTETCKMSGWSIAVGVDAEHRQQRFGTQRVYRRCGVISA